MNTAISSLAMISSRLSCFAHPLFRRLGVVGVFFCFLSSFAHSQQVPSLTQKLSPESLQQLLAPIALYPDALIALILPASTVPSDVVLASRFVASNGDPQQIPNQSWDNSVQSLASYPDVIVWMDQNLEWTTSLGQAFIVQPKDVMSAIQQLRVQAETAGNLVTTPQQVIVREKTIIRIVPAEPEYLYVPRYDPEIVYVQPYSQDYGPLLTFGVGFAVGAWLNYDCDWNRQQVYRGDWQPGWDYGRYERGGNRGYDGGGDTMVNVVNINENTAQAWQPSDRSRQQVERQQQNFNRTAANAQTSSDVTAATMNQNDRSLRNVPKPTRADFGKRGSGNRTAVATDRKSSPAIAPQTATETPMVRNPTTPPDVAGQQEKPPRNAGKAKNPDGKKADRPQQFTAPVATPQNSAPNQIGGAPAPGPSKKEQRAANAAITDRMPQTTQAPVVDQSGRTRSATAQPTPGGKRNSSQRASSPTQTDPAAEAPRSAPPTRQPDRKNANTERPGNPAPQRAPDNQPPSKSNTERKPEKSSPAPQPQPQQKEQQRPPQQKAQEQKQKPPQQQEQKQQQPKQKPQPQEKKSAPDKSAQPQKASDDKKSDKKDKKN